MPTESPVAQSYPQERGDSGASSVVGRMRATPRPSLGLAAVALVVLVVAVARIVTSDPADSPLAGDQSSYIYNAISLRRGDVSYDARDQADWVALDYDPQPRGLFMQKTDSGWALAKPLGYSVVLAVPLWLFGLRAVHLVGTGLLLGYVALWYFAGRVRWDRTTAGVVAVTAGIASHAWFFAFPAHADLFVANVVGLAACGCLWSVAGRDRRWLWIAMAAGGLLLTEKVPALLALTPVLAVGLRRARRRDALIGVGILAAVGTLSAVPYLYYSGGASWSPYGGDRYYAAETTPWSGGSVADLTKLGTDEVLSPGFVARRLTSPSSDIPSAAVTYVVGRHTGALTFLPLAPAVVAVGAAALWARRRRSSPPDDRGPPDVPGAEPSAAPPGHRELSALGWAALSSLVLYAAFYIVLFTDNYYGGAQTIGSRYFLQFSVVAVVVPVAAAVSARSALLCAGFAALWAATVLGPHMIHADQMFVDYSRTSRLQRALPYDASQKHPLGFWSGAPDRAQLLGPFTFTGSEMLSRTGVVEGSIVRAEPTRDDPGYVAYGPYMRMARGAYRVTFEYVSEAASDQTVVWMDAALVGHPAAARELRGTGGSATRESLVFEASDDVGWEFRFYWLGTSDFELHWLRVERIDG